MTNISYFDSLDTTTGQAIRWVLIDHGNEQFTSMTKAHYEAQVEHLTEIIPADEA